MKEQQGVALDFRVARSKAGLRQSDCAHLLGVHETRISQIEGGHMLPTILEAATLSVVYGKPMESLLAGLLDEIVDNLTERLQTLPPVRADRSETFNRAHTLSRLARQLEILATGGDAGAR